MKSICFEIADIGFCIAHPRHIQITENFYDFAVENKNDIYIEFQEVSELPKITGEILFRNESYSILKENVRYVRQYHDHANPDIPYAVGRFDILQDKEVIQYLTEAHDFFSKSHNCFSHIGFEELLLSKERLILHASFVSTQYGGILFCGPSGIGKSTQANLWRDKEGAELINGDRPIVGKKDNVWYAFGSPYAGSSNCFLNKSCPIRAIVMLEQGTLCSIVRLSIGSAFQKLYSVTTVNSWNPDYVKSSCDLLTKLAIEVPVYHMVCTRDKNAVTLLKTELLKGKE